MAKKKYYVVKVGRNPGIYNTWDECKIQVDGYSGAKYKSFTTLGEANDYLGLKLSSSNSTSNIKNKDISQSKQTLYAVKEGRVIGIHKSWESCKAQIEGYPNAKYKKVNSIEEGFEYIYNQEIENTVQEAIKIDKQDIKKVKTTMQVKDKVGYDVEPIKSNAKVKSSKTYIPVEDIKDEYNFIAYVDGSYDRHNKIYGSGVVVLNENGYDAFHKAGIDEYDQWNIVGELEATKFALEIALERYKDDENQKNVAIYHDLKNIQLWADGSWRAKNIYTQEYVRFIEKVSKILNIYFIKVKAHSTESIYNDYADSAANKAIKLYKEKNNI